MNKKIIFFEDERYKRLDDYISFGCAGCELSPEQREGTCMNGCYDEIIRKEKFLKDSLDIKNALICQQNMTRTVKKYNEALN